MPEETVESAVEHSRDLEGEIPLEAVPRMSRRVRFALESERGDTFRPQCSEQLGFPIKEARRALHLFSGCSGLVEESLTLWGYSVIRLDQKVRDAEICCDIMDWDFRAEFSPSHFHLIAAGPPCTEYFIDKKVGVRNLE